MKNNKDKSKNIFKKVFGKLFLKKNNEEQPSLKSQIFSMIYFEIVGACLCLLVLFALSGGKNYLKLYKELNKVIDTYDTITKDYYGQINKKDLVDDAVDAMLESVEDTYTNYSNTKETSTFLENVEGTYEGIGVSVTKEEDSYIKVVKVFTNSPASKAGVKENDLIIKVDGKDFTKKSTNDLVKYIKKAGNKNIKFTILRNNKEKELTLKRTKVAMPTISSETIDIEGNKVGYIKISLFTSVTESQFESELKKFEKSKTKGLIIDVRNNSGGYLSTVTEIVSLFTEKGKVIYQLSDENGTTKVKDKTPEKRSYPVVVLTNRASASASEILSAAIKESYSNGYVIGTNTYGKGTVQKTKQLSDGSMIKYTTQKWLTPKGEWVNDVGVTPNIYIEYDANQEGDNQLNKAKDYLKDIIK